MSLTLLNVLSVFVRRGFDQPMVKYVAIGSSSGGGAIWYVLGVIAQKVLIMSVIVAFLLHQCADLLAVHVFAKPDFALSLQYVAWSIVPHAFIFVLGEFYKGRKSIILSQALNGVSVPFLAVAYLFLTKEVELENLHFMYTSILWSVMGVGILMFVGIPRKALRSKHAKALKKDILGSGKDLYIMSLMNIIIFMGPALIVGIFAGKEEVALYQIANRFAFTLTLIVSALHGIYPVIIARLYGENKIDEMKMIATKATMLVGVLGFPAACILYFFPEPLLQLVGDQYVKAALILQILAIAYFIFNFSGALGHLLTMTKHEKLMRNNSILFCLLVCIFTSILSYQYGAVGAAVSVTGIFFAFVLRVYWLVRGVFSASLIEETNILNNHEEAIEKSN